MSRRNVARKVEVKPDHRFGNKLITKIINKIMSSGKKQVARKVLYDALILVEKKFNQNFDGDQGSVDRQLDLLNKALDNVRPLVHVRPRRVGGATYQVPVELPPAKGVMKAVEWVIKSARARHEKGMIRKLAGELIDAIENRGASMKKKMDAEAMAKANMAFAHYRW